MVPIAYFFLPDTPDKARFLTEEERIVAKARGVRQVGDVGRVGGIAWKEIGAALLDLKCWFTALMYFSCNVSDLRYSSPVQVECGVSSHVSGNVASPGFVVLLILYIAVGAGDVTPQSRR